MRIKAKNSRPGTSEKFTGRFDYQKIMLHLREMKAATTQDLQSLADKIGAAVGLPNIFAKRRTADIVAARTIFNFLAFYALNVRPTDIARFSGWSYSIVYYDIRKLRDNLPYDFRLRDSWEKCAGVVKELGMG